jgi:hypothetical protein
MSAITPRTKPTRPHKMTFDEKRLAILRLRRWFEDSLSGARGAERRFIEATIDLLYCVTEYHSNAQQVIVSLSKLKQKDLLRNIFCYSSASSQHGTLHVRVPSPSDSCP